MGANIPYIICSMNDIPSQKAYGFNLVCLDANGVERGLPIVIVRWGRQVFGYVNRCPHDGVKLDWERQTFLDPSYGTRLMCGKHGALFDLGTGECLDGPCKGDSLEPLALVVLDNDICITGYTFAGDEDGAADEAVA